MINMSEKDSLGFGYPRPQMRRDWESLNGEWRFAVDENAFMVDA